MGYFILRFSTNFQLIIFLRNIFIEIRCELAEPWSSVGHLKKMERILRRIAWEKFWRQERTRCVYTNSCRVIEYNLHWKPFSLLNTNILCVLPSLISFGFTKQSKYSKCDMHSTFYWNSFEKWDQDHFDSKTLNMYISFLV